MQKTIIIKTLYIFVVLFSLMSVDALSDIKTPNYINQPRIVIQTAAGEEAFDFFNDASHNIFTISPNSAAPAGSVNAQINFNFPDGVFGVYSKLFLAVNDEQRVAQIAGIDLQNSYNDPSATNGFLLVAPISNINLQNPVVSLSNVPEARYRVFVVVSQWMGSQWSNLKVFEKDFVVGNAAATLPVSLARQPFENVQGTGSIPGTAPSGIAGGRYFDLRAQHQLVMPMVAFKYYVSRNPLVPSDWYYLGAGGNIIDENSARRTDIKNEQIAVMGLFYGENYQQHFVKYLKDSTRNDLWWHDGATLPVLTVNDQNAAEIYKGGIYGCCCAGCDSSLAQYSCDSAIASMGGSDTRVYRGTDNVGRVGSEVKFSEIPRNQRFADEWQCGYNIKDFSIVRQGDILSEVTSNEVINVDDNCPDEYDAALIIIYENGGEILKYKQALNSIKAHFLNKIDGYLDGKLKLNLETEGIFIEKNNNHFGTDQRGNLALSISKFLKDFYANGEYVDKYDFLFIYTDFPSTGGGHISIRNNVEGIGKELMNTNLDLNGDKRLLGINEMDDIRQTEEFSINPSQAKDNLLMHEFLHQWLFFVGGPLQSKIRRNGMDGHPSNAISITSLNTGAYTGGGQFWKDNGDGTFEMYSPSIDELSNKMEDIFMYIVGLLPENEVRPLMVVDYSDENEFRRVLRGEERMVHGTAAELSASYIKQVHGERLCIDVQ